MTIKRSIRDFLKDLSYFAYAFSSSAAQNSDGSVECRYTRRPL